MHRLLVGIATFLSLSASAKAADLPVKVASPPVVAVFKWTGCFIGANAGAAVDNSDGRISLVSGGLQTEQSFNKLAFAGGLQLGCNIHDGIWVAGIEADFNWASIKATDSVNVPAGGGFGAHTEALTHRLDWFGTLRGRAGITWFETLFYVTGGLAYGRVEANAVLSIGGAPFQTGTLTNYAAIGWTAGGGIERAFGRNWSVKAEYLFVDLGTATFNVADVALALPFSARVETRFHLARLGLNYRF